MSGYISGDAVAPASLAAAERSLNEAIRLNPTYAEAYVLRGHLYYLQGRLADAMNALAKAKEIGTTDPWLPLNTAGVLIALGRLDEAASNYESVIASGTKNSKAMSGAFSGLITFYQNTEQFQKLEETYKRQIAYEPQSAWSYGNYGAFLLCTKDDAEAATAQFRKALERMNYGLARSGLAASLYRKLAMGAGDTSKNGAGKLIREAQSLRPGTPVEVVTAFCGGGPAASAVARATSHPPPPAR
jgi:Tfp pilus assembly protein PilF